LHDAILAIGHRSKGLFSSASQVQRGLFGETAYEGGDLFIDGSQWVERWGIDSVGFPLAVGDYNLPQPLLPNGSKILEWGGANTALAHVQDGGAVP
jgi:hypothetical protein